MKTLISRLFVVPYEAEIYIANSHGELKSSLFKVIIILKWKKIVSSKYGFKNLAWR